MTTVEILLSAYSVLTTAVSIFLAIRGAARTANKDNENTGKQHGTILTELGYIKSGIDDVKTEQREQRKINTDFVTRLTAVESSTKSAHRRIDTLEGRSTKD